MWNSIVSVPDHCLCIYFIAKYITESPFSPVHAKINKNTYTPSEDRSASAESSLGAQVILLVLLCCGYLCCLFRSKLVSCYKNVRSVLVSLFLFFLYIISTEKSNKSQFTTHVSVPPSRHNSFLR